MNSGIVQQIPGKYILTVDSAVIINAEQVGGSNKTLRDMIEGGEFLTQNNLSTALKAALQSNLHVLETYKGTWLSGSYKTTTFRATVNKGDWWLHTGDDMQNIDCSVLMPNGIVYYDGEYFKTIYVPYTNNVKPQPYYDAIIVGSGAGGVGAAYALSNSGWRVALIERLDTLGGTHCNGVGLYIASPTCPWFKEFVKECFDLKLMYFSKSDGIRGVGPGSSFDKAFRATQFVDSSAVINGFSTNHIVNNDYRLSQKYYKDFCEGNIDVFINTELVKTNATNRKVESIEVRNLIDGTTFELCADYYLDCSGDGMLYASDPNLTLDVDYYIGTDPASRFNEVGPGMYSAGYTGDHNGLNTIEPLLVYCYVMPQPGFKRPPMPTHYKVFTDQTSRTNFRYSPYGEEGVGINSNSYSYGTNMKAENFINKSTTWNNGEGYDRALSWYMTKSPYTATNHFGGIRKLLSIREKYRVKADRMLDAFWLQTQITSSNYVTERVIALSTWYPDIHTASQNYSPPSIIANGVPYESMIPVAYTNVLVACRGAGFSHLCASSIRLVKTMTDMGHSAGLAIKQLLDSGVRGDVRTVNVATLQEVIRIKETIQELELYFYKPIVDFEVLAEVIA